MNIKELKRVIKDLPDNMKIVILGQDHSYHEAITTIYTVLFDENENIYIRDFERNDVSKKEYDKRVKVLVVCR